MLSGEVLVIWEWKLIPQQQCSSDDSDEVNSEVTTSSDNDTSSDVEADQIRVPLERHTVTFKVIGCTKEPIYQSVLLWAKGMIEERLAVVVKLEPEPNNPYDPNAVAFSCLKQGKFERIGYVVREISHEVGDALARHEIVNIPFK